LLFALFVMQRVLHPEPRQARVVEEGMSLPAGQPAPGVRPPRDADAAADPQGDAGLLAALARGDKQALGQLYDRQGPLLLALGLRILGDRAVAEDVLHDVFLEAWHHAREFDPARGTVRAWLVTRMRSRCLDRRTTATRQQRLAEDAARQQDTTASPEQAAAPVDGVRVRTQLGALSPDLAAVVELAYFDGLSSSEIARRLQIPIGTVKSRMARALESLRQALLGPGGHT
jgi:RNA polymerase sigma-70 factor (ECF subfamily)